MTSEPERHDQPAAPPTPAFSLFERIVGAAVRWVIGPLALLGILVRSILFFTAGNVINGVLFAMAATGMAVIMAWGPFGWLQRDRWF